MLPCSPVLAASGKVYKQVDAGGRITFTDTPPIEGTETIQEMKVNIIGSGVAVDKNSSDEQPFGGMLDGVSSNGLPGATDTQTAPDMNALRAKAKRKYVANIVAPTAGQIFGPDTLEIFVSSEIKPVLAKEDKLQVLVNGESVLPLQKESVFKLPLLPSGDHNIQVQVVTKDGVTFDSNIVKITQKRPSSDLAAPSAGG